jgi:hypothetical protein
MLGIASRTVCTLADRHRPKGQHKSELQPVLTIGIEGFRELVGWVAEGTTAEGRYACGSTVRQAIDDAVKTWIRRSSTKHSSTPLRGSRRGLSGDMFEPLPRDLNPTPSNLRPPPVPSAQGHGWPTVGLPRSAAADPRAERRTPDKYRLA